MAHRKHHKPPVATGSFPQPTTSANPGDDQKIAPQTIGGPDIYLFRQDQSVTVRGRLRAPIGSPLPRPKVNTIDRPLTVGLTQWAGRDPYEMTVPVMFDAYPNGSVEAQIRDLSLLALRHSDDPEPSPVGVAGPVPTPPGMQDSPWWRITDLVEVPERTLFNGDGRRCRFAVDVTLRELVKDDTLTATLTKAKGVRKRQAVIKKGESLHQFARRHHVDAQAVARANNLRVSYVAKTEGHLRLP